MATRDLCCPACGAGLRMVAGVHAGKKVRCPRCAEAFNAPLAAEYHGDAPPVRAAVRPPPTPAGGPDDKDARPRPRPAKRRLRARASRVPLLVALCVGGVLFAVVATTAAVLLKPSKRAEAAAVPDGTPAANEPPDDDGDDRPAERAPAPAGPAAPGRLVYDRSGCARCHQIDDAPPAEAGRNGRPVDLRPLRGTRTVKYITDHIRDPRSHEPGSRMPAHDKGRIPDDDLQALGEYLAGVK